MQLTSAGLSDVGLQRDHNEDSYCILPEYQLYVVADGMGGHKAGDVASRMATHTVAQFFRATEQEDATWPFQFDPHLSMAENRLVTSIKLANKQIFEASLANQAVHGMGTTVVGALYSTERKSMYFAHVGDSRGYLIRGGEIRQITRDHSLLNDYLTVMPDMPQDQQDELPSNVITRALGMQEQVTVDLVPEPPESGDIYLLCSDGLSGMLTDPQMLEVVQAANGDLEIACQKLVEGANDHGGEDNCTVVLVKLDA